MEAQFIFLEEPNPSTLITRKKVLLLATTRVVPLWLSPDAITNTFNV